MAEIEERATQLEAMVENLPEALSIRFDHARTERNGIKAQVSRLQAVVSSLQAGVSSLQAGVSSLQAGVSSLQAGVSEIKAELKIVKAEVQALPRVLADMLKS